MKAKTKLSHTQKGFAHILLVLLVVLVLGAIGFVGYRVMQNSDKDDMANKTAATQSDTDADTSTIPEYIEWSYNGDSWMALNEGKPAPACSEPLTIKSPMDVSKATDKLYPGQVRGGDFKPHGGLGSDTATDNKIDVLMPYSAYLYRGAKYQEQGETQYLLDFIAPCGIMVRLDHLKTLSSELQSLTKELPLGGESDSRTTKFTNHSLLKQGTVVAKEVGFESPLNVFFDLGVYDLRSQNEASKDPAFANEPKRKADKEQSYYSVCWFDLLEGEEKTAISSLPARGSEGTTSDYCK